MPIPFGPRTQAALVEAISDGYSHSDMTTLFMRAGVDRWDLRGERITKAMRAQGVIQGLRDDPQPPSTSKALELVTEVVKHGGVPASPFGPTTPRWWQPLIDALSSDGYDWDAEAQRLFPAAEGLDVVEEYGLLEYRLRALGWDTAAAHYRQSLDALAAGHWESANAQVRSFLEAFVPVLAAEALDRQPRTDFSLHSKI